MSIIPRTEEQAPTALAGIPISELAKHGNDPAMLAAIVQSAYNLGYRQGQARTHNQTNTMIKGSYHEANN
jgi:hypothetical protein